MLIKNSFIVLSLTILLTVSSKGATASNSKTLENFHNSSNKSRITIDYGIYDQVLKHSVLNLGKSLRKKSPKTKPSIGTRLKSKRNIYTALEGNRFIFSTHKKHDNKKLLTQIREEMESVSLKVKIHSLNKNEQLAYWLNLYNVSLLEQLLDAYPRSRIGRLLYANDGILKKKNLSVSGVSLSLNDIQYNIVYKIFPNNPEVMYGFYQGTIGGPNIRNEAYTGKKVFSQLNDNAVEFVNSNRGTFWMKYKRSMLVSSLYKKSQQFFPDFQNDLRNHLLSYLDNRYSVLINNSETIIASIKDMTINDLTGASRKFGGSVNTNIAALLESTRSQEGFANLTELAGTFQNKAVDAYIQDYSPDTVKMLSIMQQDREVKRGTVNIKEDK